MKIKTSALAIFVLFSFPFATFAVAPQAIGSAPTIDELVLQIKALQSQVAQLTAELAATKKEVAIVKEELRITKTLKFGMADDEVRKLQEFLSTMPDIYPEGLVTGYFGSLTERAVKKWQEKNEIESVGIVGPRTRAKLAEITTSNPPVGSSSSVAQTNSNAGGNGIGNTGSSTPSGLENRAENHPTTTPSGTVPATPAIPAVPIGQTGTTTVPATPATPASPVPTSTPPTTPPATQYTITVTQGTNGTISPDTTSVISGGSQAFVIAPASGYQIGNLIVDGTNVTATGTYAFTNVTATHTISASFSQIQIPIPLSFSDDFNDGNSDGWIAAMPLSGYSREPATWRVENQQVINTPLLTSGDYYKFLLNNHSLSNLSAEAKVLFYGSGYGGLTIWHYNLDNWVDIVGYPASLGKDGKPLMIIQAVNGLVTETKYPYIWWGTGNGEGVWTDMKVIANGDTGIIDIYINNQHAITHQTQVVHRYGFSGFESGNGGGAFDDFKLDSN